MRFTKPRDPAPTEGRTGLTPPPETPARGNCAAAPIGLLRDAWPGPLLFFWGTSGAGLDL